MRRYGDQVLRITRSAHLQMLAHAIAGLPNEACGLLGGHSGSGLVEAFVPTRNVDDSTKTYSIGPDGFRAAEELFDPLGLDVVGVMHSHTHTDQKRIVCGRDISGRRVRVSVGVGMHDAHHVETTWIK